MAKVRNKQTHCPNCNFKFEETDNYCPSCGQKNTDLNISFGEFITDFMVDFFSFETKFFRTVPALLFKPGKVPKEFIDGKRSSHIPPLRIFLFLSFITFFLWSLSFRLAKEESEDEQNAILEAILDTTNTDSMPLDSLILEKDTSYQGKIDTLIDDINITLDTAEAAENQINLSREDLALIFNKKVKPEAIIDSISPEIKGFKRKAFIQSLKAYQANKKVFRSYLVGNISLVLLLLQPFFALLLKLLYIRRKEFFYVEHLVFSLYFHAFILFLVIFLILLNAYLPLTLLVPMLIILTYFYLLVGVKRFYDQSWIKSFIKTSMVSTIYMILLIPSFALGYFLLSIYFF